MNNYTAKSGNLVPIKSDGTTPNPATSPLDGYALEAATYYIPLGSSDAPICIETALLAYQLIFNAALAATITLEGTNLPLRPEGQQGGSDCSDVETGTGKWMTIAAPTGADVQKLGTDNTNSGITLTAGGTNAGGFVVNVPNAGMRRYRLKVVVTNAGNLRTAVAGKQT